MKNVLKVLAIILFIVLSCDLLVIGLLSVLTLFIYKTGFLFYGLLLLAASGLIFNLSLIDLSFNYLIERKSNLLLIGLSVVFSIFLFGASIGMSIYGLSKFDYVEEPSNLITTTEELEMNDNLKINDWYYAPIKYVEKDTDDVIVEIKHTNMLEAGIYSKDENEYSFYISNENISDYDQFKILVKDINDLHFVNYAYAEVRVYASPDNIEKLKNNSSNE